MRDSTETDADRLRGLESELERLASSVEGILQMLDQNGAETPRAAHVGVDKTRKVLDALNSYVEAHPVRSACIAFLLGALLFRGRR